MAAIAPRPADDLNEQEAAQRSTLADLQAELDAARGARHAAACRFKRATEAAPRTPEGGYPILHDPDELGEDDKSDSGVRSMPDPEQRLAARRKMLEDSKLIRMRRLREYKAKTMAAVQTVGETTLMNWEAELAGETPQPED